MGQLTAYWILFMVGIYVTMFVIVPPRVGPGLSHVGFWMGFLQAIVWLYLGQVYFGFFRLIGDPTVFGIPLIATLSWVPATILYAYYFIQADTPVKKVALVTIFAAGAAATQFILERLGLWETISWNLFYTFLLALLTHTIISVYLLLSPNRMKID